MDKSNTLWNINLNVPARSMKGILMLFENNAAQQPFARNTQAFYTPQNNEVGGHHRGHSQPTLQSRDARLSDVGRGKEVVCARQGFTCVCLCGRKHALARQSRVGGGRPRAQVVQDKPPKLKACPDPHYMKQDHDNTGYRR